MQGFSFFCGAGGSTIGYKKAGINIIGGCDIDKKQLKIYNHFQKPKILECRDIRDYLKEDFNYLYSLDLIDGSPPCTNFSVCNIKRKDIQFKAKKYAEGMATQTLEDLTLIYFKVVNKYLPKYFIMENVPNLNQQYSSLLKMYIANSGIENNYYLHKIYLNPADLGGYTTRKRFFIIGEDRQNTSKLQGIQVPLMQRKTLNDIWEALEWENINYSEKPQAIYQRWLRLQDRSIKKIHNVQLINKHDVLPIITTKQDLLNPSEPQWLAVNSLAKIQGFDYNWQELNLSKSRILYAIGMAVHSLCTEFLGNTILNNNYDYLFNKYNNLRLEERQFSLGL